MRSAAWGRDGSRMPATSMRALVVDAPGRYGLREVSRPTPGPGEVLVQVGHCGVCGTDLGIVAGRHPIPGFPVVLGHEFAGEVAGVGSGVTHLEPGQAVAVDVIKACGTCSLCRRGSPALCETPRELGIHEPGGLAEYVVAPARNAYPLPEGVSTLCGALVEPLACAIHGQDRAGVELGDTVVVVGGGAQAVLHVAVSRLRGAGRVIVSARHTRRRQRAAAMGADLVLDADRGHAAARVLDATGGRGADVVIEASGSAAGCADAVRMARRGGRVLIYGAAPPRAPLPATAFEIYQRELAILGAFGGTGGTWPRAIELIAAGRIDVAILVDAEWPLEQAPQGLERLAGDRQLLKGVIRIGETAA
jgi:2-desacetyl-2-hydroxyethyl bacteriochlorophyllide A dehydrogenase